MKKALLVALCLIAVGCMAVNGTFADDFSNAVQQVFDTALKAVESVFETITDLDDDKKTPQQSTDKTVDVSLETNDSNGYLYPGTSVIRTVTVQNQGTGSVYFRLAFAVRYDKDTWNDEFEVVINTTPDTADTTNTATTNKYTVAKWGRSEAEWKEITIEGKSYMMQVLTYTQALDAPSEGATSTAPAVTAKVSFGYATTDEQFELYRDGNFMKTQVLAIETDSFTNKQISSATAALDKAIPLNDSFNPF